MTPDAGAGGTALTRAREQAWRRYNEALTALDAVIQRVPEMPKAPPAFDERQIPALNRAAAILPPAAPMTGRGWRGRFGRFVWRHIGPPLERQQAFNTALVEHLNRNRAVHRETQKALQTMLVMLRDELEALVTFESRLLQYLQQITPLVDTNIRVLEASVAGVEAVAGVAQRASVMARREVERLSDAGRVSDAPQVSDVDRVSDAGRVSDADRVSDVGRVFRPGDSPGAPPAPRPAVFSDEDAHKYVAFEDAFRGSEEEIRARMADYAPLFEGASDVLDVGCGRGEFLELLRERGVAARGVDVNHEMVEVSRARGLDVVEGDGLTYLEGLADGSLGGLFAAQVVEHMEPAYLLRFLEAACRRLRPGSTLVLETINPACWVAFFESYIRDITHVRPLHPDTLKYLLLASGFGRVEIRFRAPVAEAAKLQPIGAPALPAAAPAEMGRLLEELTRAFNTNVERLNDRLFTYLDYAAIATV